MKHIGKWLMMASLGSVVATSCVDEIKFGDSFLEKAPSVAVTQDSIFGKAETVLRNTDILERCGRKDEPGHV